LKELGLCGGPKPVSPKAKKSRANDRHGEDLEYIPKPRELVEGIDNTDKNRFRFRR
jgi:hypothetical protein